MYILKEPLLFVQQELRFSFCSSQIKESMIVILYLLVYLPRLGLTYTSVAVADVEDDLIVFPFAPNSQV